MNKDISVKSARENRDAEIVKMHLAGVAQVDIAKAAGVTPEWVCKILKRERARLELSSR